MREEASGELADMMQLSGLNRLAAGAPEERGLNVRFVIEPQQNEKKSKEAGRPIFDDVEICEVRIVGSPDVTRALVEQKHKDRFPRQYEAFKQGLDQDAASGTVLSEWPILTRSQIEELRYFGIKTVEQLAEVADAHLTRLGAGWLIYRQKARDWLKAADDGALLNKLREELEASNRKIATLEKMLSKQTQELHSAGFIPSAPVAATADPRIDELQAQLALLAKAMTTKSQPKKRRTPKAKPQEPPKETA